MHENIKANEGQQLVAECSWELTEKANNPCMNADLIDAFDIQCKLSLYVQPANTLPTY